MAKKSSKKEFKKQSWLNVKVGRSSMKWRALLRLLRTKTFLYIDKDLAVGAFSNEDLVVFSDRFEEILQSTVDSMEEAEKMLKKKKGKKSDSRDEFEKQLDKIIMNS